MILRIKLFAIARQRLGRDQVEVALPEAATAGDLRSTLAEQFAAIADVLPHIRIAINSSYANDATVIPAGAEVALIPPVSGGWQKTIPMTTTRPNVIMLAGPNGAGKTTSSRSLLAGQLKVMTFVNADIIAQGLAGFDPESAAWEASKIMLERLDELAEKRQDFAFETTLAARSYVRRIEKWRSEGYCFQLYYFWLPSADLAIERVALRVSRGGHNVPAETIRRRYRQSLRNLFNLFIPLADAWQVFDNERRNSPRMVAYGCGSIVESVVRPEIWELMKQRSEE